MRPGEPAVEHQPPHLERGLVRARHQHHVAAHDVGQRARQVRVVGAAEQQGVDLRLPGRREQRGGQHVDLLGVELAPLDELDEARTGQRDQLDVGRVGRDRRLVGTRS